MKKQKIFWMCTLAMLVLLVLCPTVSKADTTVTITFKDQLLAERMEHIMQEESDPNAKIDGLTLTTTQEAIDKTTLLDFHTDIDAEESNKIADITGIEKYTNLESLNVRGNKISDLTPISNLTKLEKLLISNNNISNLKSLSKLTNLKEIEAYTCNITTLEGIESLVNLETLDVDNVSVKNYSNKITDITPVKNLTKLVSFNISNDSKNYSGNKISDLSALSGRTEMKDLRFNNNKISDISIISNMEKLEYLFAVGNHIEKIPENILNRQFKSFYMKNQTIVKEVKLSEYNTNEITLDLPQIFILAKQKKLLTTDEEFSTQNARLSDDSTKVTLTKESIQSGNNSVKIGTGNTNERGNIEGSIVTYVQAFEVVSVTKEPETATDGKVKVTIIVNKELNPDKIPSGWTLSNDKKSISKEFDKNGTETVTLTDKDGNTVTQKVDISNINGEKFKVTDEKQEPDGNGKIKVTITTNQELDPNKIPAGWTLLEDGKSISKVMEKGENEKVVLVSKDGASIEYTVTADGEKFKVTDEKQEPDGNGKVKVTITTNQELDPNKLPAGWTLSKDGKSISKVMDEGASETVVLYAKDGSKIQYTVTAKKQQADEIPKAGSSSIILFVIGAFLAIGLLRIKKYKNIKLK